MSHINLQFPQDPELIYLNHAGVGVWSQDTANAVKEFAEENLLRGAQFYPRWAKTETALKENLATFLHAPSPDDIALVKNTSEALSFVSAGINWKAGDNIVISDQEFPSNRMVWEVLQAQGVELRKVDLYSARTPEEALINSCDSNTRLLSISAVQFASGLRIQLKKPGDYCSEKNILFCVDAIQQLGAIDLNVQDIKAHFVMADAHKWLLAPEGIGIFYCAASVRESLKLTQFGWHMVEAMGDFSKTEWQPAKTARRFECGSPNMVGIHALNASISLFLKTGMDIVEHLIHEKTQYLIDAIKNNCHLELVSPETTDSRAGIICFKVKGCDNEPLYQQMMQDGIICAYRNEAIRLSPHYYTPDEKIKRICQIISKLTTENIAKEKAISDALHSK